MISSDSPELQTGTDTDASAPRIAVIVQTGIFPLEVIMSTAHRFSGRYHVSVQSVCDGEVEVQLKPKDGSPCDGVADSFKNELLDESLRVVVAERSSLERDLILAHALSRHPILHAEFETAEAFSDPQGLLSPDSK